MQHLASGSSSSRAPDEDGPPTSKEGPSGLPSTTQRSEESDKVGAASWTWRRGVPKQVCPPNGTLGSAKTETFGPPGGAWVSRPPADLGLPRRAQSSVRVVEVRPAESCLATSSMSWPLGPSSEQLGSQVPGSVDFTPGGPHAADADTKSYYSTRLNRETATWGNRACWTGSSLWRSPAPAGFGCASRLVGRRRRPGMVKELL